MNDGELRVPIRFWDVEEGSPGTNSLIYDVVVKFSRTIDLDDLQAYLAASPDDQAAAYPKADAITALNIIIAKTPYTTPGLFAFGGNRFYLHPVDRPVEACLDLGGGLVAVRGYYASVRTSTARILVNVHTITSAFYPSGTVCNLMRLHGYKSVPALRAFLEKLRIKTSPMKTKDGHTVVGKTKTIAGLSDLDARTQTFISDDGKKWTVEDYFFRTYNIRLAHPEVPVIQVGYIDRDRNGNPLQKSERKPIWFPAELALVMDGQIYIGSVSPDQTTAMLKYAARPPSENARRLTNDGLQTMGFTPNNATLVSHPTWKN